MVQTHPVYQTQIRLMQFGDVLNIANWMIDVPLWQTYQLTQAKIIEQFNHAIEQNQLLYVIEEVEQQAVVGFAWLLPKGMFARSPYLKQISIHPDYSGKGIGAKLLTFIEEQSQQFASDLFLLTSDFNINAHQFYKRHGYEHIGAIPNYILPDVTEFIFHKKLEGA